MYFDEFCVYAMGMIDGWIGFVLTVIWILDQIENLDIHYSYLML